MRISGRWAPAALVLALMLPAMGALPAFGDGPTRYEIDADTAGVIEIVDHIVNTSIVSNDPNVYKAEYEAGFIQGALQKEQMIAARDNNWDMLYLTDTSHTFPTQIPPPAAELTLAAGTLNANFQYTLDYVRRQGDSAVGKNLRRLVYRLVGIYHGATKAHPEALPFDGAWYPAFSPAELVAGYETPGLTFTDVYFLSAAEDAADVWSNGPTQADQVSKCSAFVKVVGDEVLITHNTWCGFQDQSSALTLWVNGDFTTVNTVAPGTVGSNTDFGYNNKGLLFNETTHHATYTEPKVAALWMFWRSALAEQFATSMDEFFDYISLEPSGTYASGYMVADARTRDIGLVEMSYKSFVFFKLNGEGAYDVTTKPEGLNKSYDVEMMQPGYMLGINYPASEQIREDLKAIDTRPARKRQFMELIGPVSDVESAKALITYTDPDNPLSINGRWDLGYGETPLPKTVPDGTIDAKVASGAMARAALELKGVLDPMGTAAAFWMKFGTARVNGKPFIWSESQWKDWKHRLVPDRLDGEFVLLKTHVR